MTTNNMGSERQENDVFDNAGIIMEGKLVTIGNISEV